MRKELRNYFQKTIKKLFLIEELDDLFSKKTVMEKEVKTDFQETEERLDSTLSRRDEILQVKKDQEEEGERRVAQLEAEREALALKEKARQGEDLKYEAEKQAKRDQVVITLNQAKSEIFTPKNIPTTVIGWRTEEKWSKGGTYGGGGDEWTPAYTTTEKSELLHTFYWCSMEFKESELEEILKPLAGKIVFLMPEKRDKLRFKTSIPGEDISWQERDAISRGVEEMDPDFYNDRAKPLVRNFNLVSKEDVHARVSFIIDGYVEFKLTGDTNKNII